MPSCGLIADSVCVCFCIMHMLLCISVRLFPTNAYPQSVVQNWRHFNPSWEHISHVTIKQSLVSLKNLYSPPVYILDAASVKFQESANWKQLETDLSPSFWSTGELYTIIVCVLCLVVDFICLFRRSVLSASLPFLFVTTLTIPLCSALFFPFCFLFLHLSWACSAVFLPCLSLAVLWQLLKGCLSWGTDPRTKTRPRLSTGAPCVRSPLAVMLIFHCLHSLPSCQYGDIPKEKSLISAALQYETDSNYFRFLSQLLNSGLKSLFWNYQMS